jgi:hypothetical protein
LEWEAGVQQVHLAIAESLPGARPPLYLARNCQVRHSGSTAIQSCRDFSCNCYEQVLQAALPAEVCQHPTL